MRTLRASEFGSYLYCKRAWWYRLQGIESQNQAEMQAGIEFHQGHAAGVWRVTLLRVLGWGLLIAALVVLVIALTIAWVG